jgi:uncharacterized protein YneF (UPF0154 family)
MNRDWLTILVCSILIAVLLGLVIGLEIGMRIERKQSQEVRKWALEI